MFIYVFVEGEGEKLKEDQKFQLVSPDPQIFLTRSVLSEKRSKARNQNLSRDNVGSSYLTGSVTKSISSVTLIPHNYH